MIIKLFEEISRQNSRDTRIAAFTQRGLLLFFETAKPFHEVDDLLIREIALAVKLLRCGNDDVDDIGETAATAPRFCMA